MAPLPLLKMGTLLVKTLSKPIANIVKSQAKDNKKFRAMCINGGQRVHRM